MPDMRAGTFIKSVGIIYLLVLGGCLFHSLWGDTLGFDIWFHLKNGCRIITEGAIPHDDPSLPALSELGPWYFPNYEWLFGVLSFGIFKQAGTWGLDALRLVLVFATFALCLATMLREARNRSGSDISGTLLVVAATVLTLAVAASTRRFEPRPHLISAFGLAWLSFAFSSTPSLPMLGVTAGLMAIWANSHIEFMLGLGLIVLLAIRDFLTHWIAARGADPERRDDSGPGITTPFRDWLPHARPFAALLGIGIILFLLTPASWRVIPLASEYYARQAATLQQFGFGVNELLPTSEWRSGPWGMLLTLAVLGILIAPDRRRMLIRALPALPFCVLPSTSARHLYPAVILLAPHVVSALHAGLERFSEGSTEARRAIAVLSLGAVPIFLLLFGSAFTNPRLPHPVFDMGSAAFGPYRHQNFYPEQALRYLKAENLKGTVFTLDRWGNFMLAFDGLTASAPERRPFIHNMGQTFPYQLLADYLTIITAPTAREALIEKYKIEIFLLPLRQADYLLELADWLQNSPAWKLVSWDDTACVFLRAASTLNPRSDLPKLRAIRPAAFTNDEALLRAAPDLVLAAVELEHHLTTPHGKVAWNAHLWLGTLLEWQEEETQAIEILKQACEMNPSGFAALFRLGGLLGKTGQQAEAKAFLERARAVCPSDAANRFNLAIAFKKNRQFAECRELLISALEADPGFAPARKQLEALSQL